MTFPIPAEAVEAAAEALCRSSTASWDGEPIPAWESESDVYRAGWRDDARKIVAAALPSVERAVRDKIAAEIAANCTSEHHIDEPWLHVGSENACSYYRAARIARGVEWSE